MRTVVGIAVLVAWLALPAHGAGTSCILTSVSTLLQGGPPDAEDATIFIGTLEDAADATQVVELTLTVDAVLRGDALPPVVTITHDWFNFQARPIEAGTYGFVVWTQRDGSLASGPCVRPTPIHSRQEAEQLIALSDPIAVRSDFADLPDIRPIAITPDPTESPAPRASASASEAPVRPTSGVSAPLVAGALLVTILSAAIAAWRLARGRRPVAALIVGGIGVGVIVLASVISRPSPGLGELVSPDPTAMPSATASASAQPARPPTRDAAELAGRFTALGMACERAHTATDGVVQAGWTCVDQPTRQAERVVAFGESNGEPSGFSMQITDHDGQAFDRPIAVDEFEWLLIQVLEPAELDEARQWLDATWAMNDAWIEIGNVTLRKWYGGIQGF